MIDTTQLLQVLRLNGINENTPADKLDKVLLALKYSPEDKQQALEVLKSQGWTVPMAPVNMPQVSWAPMPTSTATPTSASTPTLASTPAPVPAQPQPFTAPMPSVGQTPPPFQVMPMNAPNSDLTPTPHKKTWIFYVVIAIIIALVIIGGYFTASKFDLLPFTKTTSLTPETFFSSLLTKSATINSSAYKASFSLNVGTRDADAKPFEITGGPSKELLEQYKNDKKRSEDLSGIFKVLKVNNYSSSKVVFPSTLGKAMAGFSKNSYYKNTSIIDPVTKKEYEYKSVDGGKDFKLTITFETDNAIKEIKESYDYSTTTTLISAKTVTFTKESPSYIYLRSEPEKPFIAELAEQMDVIPAGLNVLFDVSAQADLTSTATMGNWLAQFNAEGNFDGDLTYKVNAEARKKDSDFYVRINNIPSIVGSFSSLKGKWIKISTAVATSTSDSGFNPFDDIAQDLQDAEKSYKEQRQALTQISKKAVEIADAEKLVTFKNNPVKENVEGRNLTKYELQIRKEAILPFYQKLLAEISKNSEYDDLDILADQGTVEYLQSKEFDEMFDFFNKNVKISLWIDSDGYPAIIEYSLRIVPPDTAVRLKNKQINVVLKVIMSEINKPVKVDVPSGAVPIDEVLKELGMDGMF